MSIPSVVIASVLAVEILAILWALYWPIGKRKETQSRKVKSRPNQYTPMFNHPRCRCMPFDSPCVQETIRTMEQSLARQVLAAINESAHNDEEDAKQKAVFERAWNGGE